MISDELRANHVLAIAAILGREFRVDLLRRVCQLPEDDVVSALEEATRIALVEEQRTTTGSPVYRFAHAFFRQTLYEETGAPRRIGWHLQVARVLEDTYAAHIAEHALELAEHWSYSSQPIDLAKAVGYFELAAERAMALYVFGEAVRDLERALERHSWQRPQPASARRSGQRVALSRHLAPRQLSM